ncbi:hypothetical protein C0J52_24975 [Blattella germanica]|nr:hypothetical protein C0J52_24975 [Blattella germanica]
MLLPCPFWLAISIPYSSSANSQRMDPLQHLMCSTVNILMSLQTDDENTESGEFVFSVSGSLEDNSIITWNILFCGSTGRDISPVQFSNARHQRVISQLSPGELQQYENNSSQPKITLPEIIRLLFECTVRSILILQLHIFQKF